MSTQRLILLCMNTLSSCIQKSPNVLLSQDLRQRQGVLVVDIILGYIMKPCLKKKSKISFSRGTQCRLVMQQKALARGMGKL